MSCQHSNTKHADRQTAAQDLSGDAAVFVQIVQVKGPVEFICYGASQDDGQAHNKVLQEGGQEKTHSGGQEGESEEGKKSFSRILLEF